VTSDSDADSDRVADRTDRTDGSSAIPEAHTKDRLYELFSEFLRDHPSKGVSTRDPEEGVTDSEYVSHKNLWSSFVDTVSDLVPSLPQVVTSPLKRRTQASIDRPVEDKKLPLHPAVSTTLDVCMKEVKEGTDKSEPLGLGKFLKGERSFIKKLWPPSDFPKLHLPSLRLDSLKQVVPNLKASTYSLSEVELQLMEGSLRENLILISHLKWALEAQKSLMSRMVQGEDPKDFESMASSLNLTQDLLLTHLEDATAVNLSNVSLRRRDAVLSQNEKLSTTTSMSLRSHSIKSSVLMKPSSEMVSQAKDERKSDLLLEVIESNLKAGKARAQGKKTKGSKGPRVSSASGVQAQPAQPFQASQAPSTSGFRGRGRGRGGSKRGGVLLYRSTSGSTERGARSASGGGKKNF